MHALLDVFESVCASRGGRTAAADPHLELDYRTFQAAAIGLSYRIRRATDQPRVGILMPSSAAGAVAIFACWYAGRVPVPLNFLLSGPELADIVRDADLELVLTCEPFISAAYQLGLQTIMLDAGALAPSAGTKPSAAASEVAVVLYTSGTSGRPKGVCLTFDNLVRNAQACIEHARISPEQTFLSVLPQFHSFGFTAMTVTPLLLGATVHYLPRFSPLAAMRTIAERKISVFMAVPSMYGALAHLKEVPPGAFDSLTLAISGGEPLPTAIYEVFRERFGVTIYEGYGMTETSPVVSINTPEGNKPGSVGRPIPGVEVVAVDEQGRTLPRGETGELVVSGHGVMPGYFNRPEETQAVLRGGRLWTGDIGHVDEEGYIFITGRAKEMLIVAGENVFPREIENVLLGHPAVAEAAVVGVRDEVRGELPAAFVVLRPGAEVSEQELRAYCRPHLAGYKVPRWVRIVEAFPRTPTGKVCKRTLRAQAAP